jgi:hypothetical protein
VGREIEHHFLEGSQASPTHPSDRGRMKVKTLFFSCWVMQLLVWTAQKTLFPVVLPLVKLCGVTCSVFWDVTLYSALKVNRNFRGKYCFHLQGQKIRQARNYCETGSKELQRTTWRYIPEDKMFHNHCCEILILYIFHSRLPVFICPKHS